MPKTYLHLYPENQITVDARVPLNKFGGKTAFDIAEEAYLKHESQQWMWFYVTDGAPEDNRGLNCTIFGLYRTMVGADTGNDIMEHVLSYHEQELRQAAEATATTAPETTEEENTTAAATPDPGGTGTASGSIFKTILIILGVLLGLLIIFMIVIAIISSYKKKKREEEILAKENETLELQRKYFGPDGELFKKQEALLKPIQDEIYNAVQEVASENFYSIVKDRSADPSLIYLSNKLDISDEVLNKLGAK